MVSVANCNRHFVAMLRPLNEFEPAGSRMMARSGEFAIAEPFTL